MEAGQAKRDAAAERCIIELGKGNIGALEELYSVAATSVYSYAVSVLGDCHEAEDVLHDSMVKIYASAGSYKPCGKPFAWIISIAKNLCIDRLRRRKREKTADPESLEAELPGSAVIEAEDRLMLRSFLSALKPEDRQIVVLHTVAGFKFREIAGLLHIPAPTVMTKYRRATIRLKNKFGEVEEEG